MSRTTFTEATTMWVLGRVLRPITGRRWARLRAQAQAMLRQDQPGRCLIGHGAFRDHAVYGILQFQSICGQPVGEVTGGDMPGDIGCWTCLRMLKRAARIVIREAEEAVSAEAEAVANE